MIRSPLHLLISLQRFLYRTKARHKSSFIFSRPITKSTSWSATISLRIPRTSPTSSKSIPSSVQQETSRQLLRMTQRPSPGTLSSTSRRLLTSRQSPGPSHAAIYIQYRTMLSAGNTTNHQVTTILNPAQFFAPRPPILGVHIFPPPTPHSSLRYANNPPWANKQHQQLGPSSPLSQSSSIGIDVDDVDDVDDNIDDDFCNNMQYRRHINERILATTTSISATRNTNPRQQPYRPPNMRGMADLMENGNEYDNYISQTDTDETGNNRHSPGLVHRGQPPRKSSPRSKQSVASTSARRMSAMNVLRHDDLSLQTTKKRRSSANLLSATDATPSISTAPNDDNNCNSFLDLTQHWYISIPMDLTFLMQPDDSSPTPTFSSATRNLFSMENAVSVLDPMWMKSFDQWGKLIRSHLTKVMVLIQLIGLEAQRYYAKGRRRHSANDATGRYEHGDQPGYSNDEAAALSNRRATTIAGAATPPTTRMDFKMTMMKKANIPSELRIYLPHQLCTPLPTTIQNIRQWVHQLMNDPPTFDVKFGTKDDILDRNGENGTAHYDKNFTTAMMEDDLFNTLPGGCTVHDGRQRDMDGSSEDNSDNEPWRISPLYFQGIHSFLNHVDSMIDASPAFATGDQRRFSL